MKYVDGFVLTVPKAKLVAYKKMATEGYKTWMKFGALDYKECVQDDLTPPHVTRTFAKAAAAKDDEVVIFSYIVFKSRKHRDTVNKKVMAYFDKKYAGEQQDMPFDMKRMSYGGFQVFVGK